MRILFLAPGNSVHTIKWVNALKKKDNEVCLVSLAEHRVTEPLEPGIIVQYLCVSGKKGYYVNVFALRRIVREFSPDIINVHYASGYGTLMRVSRLPKIKCILSVWGSDVYRFPYESRINFFIIKKNLMYASHIASTSHCMKKQVRCLLKREREITVTPFGVDINAFDKDTLSFNSDQFVFGCTKSVEYQYGIDVLIKAFAQFFHSLAAKEQDRILLKIYGTGSVRKEMQNLANAFGVARQVEFCGRISNRLMPEALNKIDVLCLASVETESFGVAALEGMACQVPVIASDVPGYKEVVVHNRTGLIVPQLDVDATSKAMKRLYEDSELRRRLGENGRQWVIENYEWEHCVQIMMDLYQQIYQKKVQER